MIVNSAASGSTKGAGAAVASGGTRAARVASPSPAKTPIVREAVFIAGFVDKS